MKDSRKGSSWFGKTKTKDRFKKTKKVIKNGPACRIYGSVETKKMNGNLHVTLVRILSLTFITYIYIIIYLAHWVMVTLQLNIQIINVSIRDFKNDTYKFKLKKSQ